MGRDPIVEWHALLQEVEAQESMALLDARQRAFGLTFGERPLCTVVRPRFLRLHDYDTLRHACDMLLGAFRLAGEAAATDAAFRAQFRLHDWEVTLLESAPRLHVMSPLSRIDAFIDPTTGIPHLTEYNGETPAGTAYCDALSTIFQSLPAMHRFAETWTVRPLPGRGHLLGTLVETWQRFRGLRQLPSIAIVDWDDVPTIPEFRLCERYFNTFGSTCRIVTPAELEYTGGELRTADGFKIDLVYKRVLIHELIEQEGMTHPLVRAVVDGAVCMVNPFSCKPLHKKASLAVLSDERNADRFPAEQRAAIARHVPWTRVVEERHTEHNRMRVDLLPWISAHKDELVLKPNDDYGGAGIVLGWEVDQAAWNVAVAKATAEPYIVQQRIALPKEMFPTVTEGQLVFDERIVDTAPFAWHGAWSDGMLTRISTSTLVNVTAGGGSTVPTFVVEPR